MVGGLGDLQAANDVVREIAEKVKADCETNTNKKFDLFEPTNFKTQIVNGVNYFIKVKVGDDDYVHVRAHKSFKGEISLTAVQENHKSDSPVEHF